MSEGITGLDLVLRRVKRLERSIKESEKPLTAAGAYVIGSITRNFNASGRPNKWAPLAASTVRRRRRGRGKGGVKPLVDTGRLRNSPSMSVSREGVRVGTNMVQAKRQHFGYPGGTGRGHARTPARPFMMLQDPEDFNAIGMIFGRQLQIKS